MADTTIATDSRVQKWLSSYYTEYVRDSGFKPYIGRGSSSIINAKYELSDGGKTINLPLITRLKGSGVTGSATLEGNEEALGNFNQKIEVDFLRHAVRVAKPENTWGTFDLLTAAGDQLKVWAADRLRSDIIAAFGSIDGVAYATATAAQKNTWTANNSDRVLFGNAVANYNATHATAINAITAAMTLTAGVVSLLKRIAMTADPHIRPTRSNATAGREYFVLFVGPMAFRDLKLDSVMVNANRDARPRDVESNPIFQDGDLIYDGVIIREIPEIAGFTNANANPARVEPLYLCGQQAIGLAWGQEPKVVRDDFDYGFVKGIGTEECRGIQKMRFGTGTSGALKDHGMVTGFIAAAADA